MNYFVEFLLQTIVRGFDTLKLTAAFTCATCEARHLLDELLLIFLKTFLRFLELLLDFEALHCRLSSQIVQLLVCHDLHLSNFIVAFLLITTTSFEDGILLSAEVIAHLQSFFIFFLLNCCDIIKLAAILISKLLDLLIEFLMFAICLD